jgi:hypothetical protein
VAANWTARFYPRAQIRQGADRVSGPTRRRGSATGRCNFCRAAMATAPAETGVSQHVPCCVDGRDRCRAGWVCQVRIRDGGSVQGRRCRARNTAPTRAVMPTRNAGLLLTCRRGTRRPKQRGSAPVLIDDGNRLLVLSCDAANKTCGLHKLLHCVGKLGARTLRACWNQPFSSRPYSLRRLSASLFSSP